MFHSYSVQSIFNTLMILILSIFTFNLLLFEKFFEINLIVELIISIHISVKAFRSFMNLIILFWPLNTPIKHWYILNFICVIIKFLYHIFRSRFNSDVFLFRIIWIIILRSWGMKRCFMFIVWCRDRVKNQLIWRR